MSDFNTPPDLTSPKQVADQCIMYSEYVAQQAEAVARGTATGSHPNPGHFYGEMAKVMKAAAVLLSKAVVVSPVSSSDDDKDKSVDGRTADEIRIVAAIESAGILREYDKGEGGIEPLPDFVARAVRQLWKHRTGVGSIDGRTADEVKPKPQPAAPTTKAK